MGSPEDLERIVAEHQAMVFRTLARLLGRADNLEDLAQEAFLRLFRALPRFRADASLSTYLYRIVLNVAQTEWRRRRRERERTVSLSAPSTRDSSPEDAHTWEDRIAAPETSALERMEQAQFQRLVELQLQQLSEPERAILILFHGEECTYEQIAAIVGAPINTVRTHLHRARKKLRERVTAAATQPARASAVQTPGDTAAQPNLAPVAAGVAERTAHD